MFKLFLAISILILATLSLNAAVYKGQKIYVQKCINCHSPALDYLHTKTAAKWKAIMADKGKPLSEAHLRDIRAKETWDYFKDPKYFKKSKHLKQFLMEYAKDSGKIPALN